MDYAIMCVLVKGAPFPASGQRVAPSGKARPLGRLAAFSNYKHLHPSLFLYLSFSPSYPLSLLCAEEREMIRIIRAIPQELRTESFLRPNQKLQRRLLSFGTGSDHERMTSQEGPKAD